MSQAANLADLDALLHGAFAAAGMGDSATYRSGPADAEVPCVVLVDQGAQLLEDRVVSDQVTIRAQLAEIGTPRPGGVFTIGDVRWRVDRVSERDESAVTLVVSRA
jgi:hypothetical protein